LVFQFDEVLFGADQGVIGGDGGEQIGTGERVVVRKEEGGGWGEAE